MHANIRTHFCTCTFIWIHTHTHSRRPIQSTATGTCKYTYIYMCKHTLIECSWKSFQALPLPSLELWVDSMRRGRRSTSVHTRYTIIQILYMLLIFFFYYYLLKKKCRLYNNINNLIECTSFVCCLFVTVKKKNGHLTLLHIKRAVSYEIIFQGVWMKPPPQTHSTWQIMLKIYCDVARCLMKYSPQCVLTWACTE